MFQRTSSEFLFNFRFTIRKSPSQQKLAKKIIILQYGFARKTSLKRPAPLLPFFTARKCDRYCKVWVTEWGITPFVHKALLNAWVAEWGMYTSPLLWNSTFIYGIEWKLEQALEKRDSRWLYQFSHVTNVWFTDQKLFSDKFTWSNS